MLATFFRAGHSFTDFLPAPKNSFRVILTEEKQPGSTGVVHIGRLSCDDTMCSSCGCAGSKVIAKIGFSSSEKDVLTDEHEIYTLLHEAGVKGTPKVIGLFCDMDQYEEDDIEGPYALVLSYAGSSLHKRAHTISREAN